jgi:hypothetical protein
MTRFRTSGKGNRLMAISTRIRFDASYEDDFGQADPEFDRFVGLYAPVPDANVPRLRKRMTCLLKSTRSAVAACALAFVLNGCSSYSIPSPISAVLSPSQASGGKSSPRVQDCLVVDTATGDVTKSRFVCHGKTYTAQELYNLRTDNANSK